MESVLSYSSGLAKHIVETNSSSDEVYLIKVNKLTKALNLEQAWCCLSQADLSLKLWLLVQRTSATQNKSGQKMQQWRQPSMGFEGQ